MEHFGMIRDGIVADYKNLEELIGNVSVDHDLMDSPVSKTVEKTATNVVNECVLELSVVMRQEIATLKLDLFDKLNMFTKQQECCQHKDKVLVHYNTTTENSHVVSNVANNNNDHESTMVDMTSYANITKGNVADHAISGPTVEKKYSFTIPTQTNNKKHLNKNNLVNKSNVAMTNPIHPDTPDEGYMQNTFRNSMSDPERFWPGLENKIQEPLRNRPLQCMGSRGNNADRPKVLNATSERSSLQANVPFPGRSALFVSRLRPDTTAEEVLVALKDLNLK